MERELKRYLNAIVILLSLNSGFLATLLLISGGGETPAILITVLLGALLVGGFVWFLTDVITQ